MISFAVLCGVSPEKTTGHTTVPFLPQNDGQFIPYCRNCKFFRGDRLYKRIFHLKILFQFHPFNHCFKGPIISPIFYTIPQKVMLLFLELFEEK